MSAPLCTEGEVSLDLTHAHTIPIPAGHTFTADPAGVLDGRVYCEVMSRRDGIGSIAAYSSQGWQRVEIPVGDRHLSFPQLVRHEAKTYLFPEMAQVGPPMLFRLEASGLATDLGQPLKGLEGLRLLDGTLLEHRDHWYLFASQADELDSRLDLWQSPSLHGRWTLHPQSPVCLDPRRARMAGPLIREGGSLFRVGQDGATAYGSGAVVHRIVELTPESFSEVVVARVSVAGACGPHTLLVDDGGFWFDYYRDAWTPMAGVRRVRARLRPR